MLIGDELSANAVFCPMNQVDKREVFDQTESGQASKGLLDIDTFREYSRLFWV